MTDKDPNLIMIAARASLESFQKATGEKDLDTAIIDLKACLLRVAELDWATRHPQPLFPAANHFESHAHERFMSWWHKGEDR